MVKPRYLGVVMYNRVFSAAFVAVLLGATSALAQSVASVGGPAEMPPAGFKGQQFVDSRGCVYLKAGLAGQVNWVLRVGHDRKPMCNKTPTFGAKPVIEVATAAEMAAPAQVAEVQIAPAPRAVTVATTAPQGSTPLVAPSLVGILDVPAARPQTRVSGGYETTGSGTGNRRIGCFTSAPVAERVKLRNGGTAVVCTTGDGTLTGWRPPIYADGAGVGASLSDPPVGFVAGNSHGTHSYGSNAQTGGYASADAGTATAPVVPEGYKLAWDDDRLNPKRGKGTAQGWAAQDQVWTRDVPAVAAAPAVRLTAASSSNGAQTTTRKTVSTKSTGGTGRAFIQVGTFGVVSNADGAVARLQALGLPVARAKMNKGGKALQIVMAGPFANAADAQTFLSTVRGAGFGDAFVK